jgi:hypothetical protein
MRVRVCLEDPDEHKLDEPRTDAARDRAAGFVESIAAERADQDAAKLAPPQSADEREDAADNPLFDADRLAAATHYVQSIEADLIAGRPEAPEDTALITHLMAPLDVPAEATPDDVHHAMTVDARRTRQLTAAARTAHAYRHPPTITRAVKLCRTPIRRCGFRGRRPGHRRTAATRAGPSDDPHDDAPGRARLLHDVDVRRRMVA